MGYDGWFILRDFPKEERLARSQYELFTSLHEDLSDPPDWLGTICGHLESRSRYLDELESPPAVNDSLSDALSLICPILHLGGFQDKFSFWNWRSKSILHAEIPEFLEARSERAETLWWRLIGFDDVYDVELDSGQYQFESTGAGYLSPEERRELGDELKPLLLKINELYDEIDANRDDFVVAREMHVVECVHALCVSGSRSAGLAYNYTH